MYITQEFSYTDGFVVFLPVYALNVQDHCSIQQKEEKQDGLLIVPIHVALFRIITS